MAEEAAYVPLESEVPPRLRTSSSVGHFFSFFFPTCTVFFTEEEAEAACAVVEVFSAAGASCWESVSTLIGTDCSATKAGFGVVGFGSACVAGASCCEPTPTLAGTARRGVGT